MPNLGPTELLIIAFLVLLLFGAAKLPDMARSLGRSMRIFKSEVKEMKKDDDEDGEGDEPKQIQQQQYQQQPIQPQQQYQQQQYPAQPQQQYQQLPETVDGEIVDREDRR